jgi:ribonucleoside-triphosphate reductase
MGLDKEKDKELIEKRFFESLDKLMDKAERQLLSRYEYVRDNLKAKDMPFAMGQHLYMGSENLKDEDSIEPALKNGTLSMGFIGLAECLTAMTGHHHGESQSSNALGLRIVKHMRDYMDKATLKTHLNFSLFATPAEGLSGKFTAQDKKKYGIIPGVTDKEYYTNSSHVPVKFDINHFKKIEIEGAYHKFENAGHICYVEFQSPLVNNLAALEKVINHMADSDVGYAGINFPIDYCDECHFQGVIDSEDCPVCGSHDHIHHIRRVTGYFSETKHMNDAKQAEVRDRKRK